jgi:hypothetical protein
MRIYLPSRSATIPEKLKWHLFYGGDARNARFRKKEIRAAAKKRCLEVKNNKYALICALLDRTDKMNKFESYMCKSVFRILKYKPKDLVNKDLLELAEMLVVAEEIAGRHCHYPDSYCEPSKAIAIKKNQLSFACDCLDEDGCEGCESYYCYFDNTGCVQKYRTWLAQDLSNELCKDGSLRYGFLKEMLHLYMNPNEGERGLYPYGTFHEDGNWFYDPEYDKALEIIDDYEHHPEKYGN